MCVRGLLLVVVEVWRKDREWDRRLYYLAIDLSGVSLKNTYYLRRPYVTKSGFLMGHM